MIRYLLPLALFVALAVFLGIGLSRDPHELPSPLVGRPAPAFTLPRLAAGGAAGVAGGTAGGSAAGTAGGSAAGGAGGSAAGGAAGTAAGSAAVSPADAATAAEFRPADMLGKVWLLNVWASWCVSCRQEHPVLLDIARRGDVPLVGLDYKDTPQAAATWLAQHGNPYLLSAVDADGRVGIDYGVYGVPETYLIDRAGTIRYKQIGPISAETLNDKIMPLVRELRR